MDRLLKFLFDRGLTLTITPRRYCAMGGGQFAAVVHPSGDVCKIEEVLSNITGGDEEAIHTETFLFSSGYPAVEFSGPDDLEDLYVKIVREIMHQGEPHFVIQQDEVMDGEKRAAWEYAIHQAIEKAAAEPFKANEIDFRALVRDYYS